MIAAQFTVRLALTAIAEVLLYQEKQLHA